MVNLAAAKVGPVRCTWNQAASCHSTPNKRQFANLNTIIDNSPWTQVAILGCVTFCSVGMFSAVSGLGAGCVETYSTGDGDSIANVVFSPVVPRTPNCLTRQTGFCTAASPLLASLLVRSTYVVLQRPHAPPVAVCRRGKHVANV